MKRLAKWLLWSCVSIFIGLQLVAMSGLYLMHRQLSQPIVPNTAVVSEYLSKAQVAQQIALDEDVLVGCWLQELNAFADVQIEFREDRVFIIERKLGYPLNPFPFKAVAKFARKGRALVFPRVYGVEGLLSPMGLIVGSHEANKLSLLDPVHGHYELMKQPCD